MFAKIFRQIFDSSIVENPELRFTFMDLLVLADADGVVDMTHESIARRTNRPIELIRKTIGLLEHPDSRSRTPDEGGARIRRLDDHRDWGWIIVNYGHFRMIASDQQRREKTTARVAKFRRNQRTTGASSTPVTDGNAEVTRTNAGNAKKKEKEKKKEKKKQKEETLPGFASGEGADGPRPTSKYGRPTDDEFLQSLENDPTYAGINIRTEFGKLVRWCQLHGKQPTRRRFLNWLNRAERPMTFAAPSIPVSPQTPRTSAEIIP